MGNQSTLGKVRIFLYSQLKFKKVFKFLFEKIRFSKKANDIKKLLYFFLISLKFCKNCIKQLVVDKIQNLVFLTGFLTGYLVYQNDSKKS